MIVDSKMLFLQKKAHEGCLVSTYEYYKHWIDNELWDYTYDVIGSVKYMLNYHSPDECIDAIYKCENENDYTWLIDEYINIFTVISAMHCSGGDYEYGAIWAKRAVDSYDILYPFFNEATKEKLKSKSKAFELFEKIKTHFNASLYSEFVLEWEGKSYRSMRSGTANNNKRRNERLD
jgi:hypothetical protein